MIDQDTYEVEVQGLTRSALIAQALDLASVYFETEPENLMVLPFEGQPKYLIEGDDGFLIQTGPVVARVTVAMRMPWMDARYR